MVRRLKGLSVDGFITEMNEMLTQSYELAAQHHNEAAYITLTAKQLEALTVKVQEIREQWDGLYYVNEED